MPRSFLLTNRRYIPTPPPPNDADNTDVNNDSSNLCSDQIPDQTMVHVQAAEGEGADCGTGCTSSEMIVAHILIRQSEQTEAVNLALDKPTADYNVVNTTTVFGTNHNVVSLGSDASNTNHDAMPVGSDVCEDVKSDSIVIINDGLNRYHDTFEGGCGDGRPRELSGHLLDSGRDSSVCYVSPDNATRPSVIYTVGSSNDYGGGDDHGTSVLTNMDVSSHDNTEVGMDLSLKADQQRSPPLPNHPSTHEPEGQDKSSLSDGDSDSGCSTQNEARSQLPPEVEYGWAECHAHFSLLYDLMTQGGRKAPGKEGEQGEAYPGGKEAADHEGPYDYSRSPGREGAHEPHVLYELMTESPRKAASRDVPELAAEVEVSMQQQYPPHHHHHNQHQLHEDQHHLGQAQQQYHHHHQLQHQQSPLQQQQQQQHQSPPHQQQYHPSQSQQYQYQQHVPAPTRPHFEEHRLATLQEVAKDRGLTNVSAPVQRYEPRRSLNDLLFAAGLPPVSPPSPSCSLSPSASPTAEDDIHACEDCGKRYSTSSNLARHRQTHRSQGDKKARKCPHCDKVYVSMPAFSMHVRTHNQGCACPHCGKRFSRPWLLQGHIRTHTGEKPFACPQCGKSFADKSNLRAHIQTHSSEKPYVCGRCGKAFALKSYLYKHEESSCMRGERFRPLRRQVSAEC